MEEDLTMRIDKGNFPNFLLNLTPVNKTDE